MGIQLFGFELPEADDEEAQPVKFKAEGELTEDNMKTFAKGLLEKTLSPYLKSAPEPEKVTQSNGATQKFMIAYDN